MQTGANLRLAGRPFERSKVTTRREFCRERFRAPEPASDLLCRPLQYTDLRPSVRGDNPALVTRWFRRHMPITTQEIIEAAIEGLEAQKQQIDNRIAELRGMLNGASSQSTSADQSQRRRTMSATARERIAEAQRKRWAAKKAGSERAAAPSATKAAKRHISPAGRRRIIEATKKRWAAFRAAQKRAAK